MKQSHKTILLWILLILMFVTVYNLLAFRLLDDPFRLPASLVSLLFLTYLVGTIGSSGVGRLDESSGLMCSTFFRRGRVGRPSDSMMPE